MNEFNPDWRSAPGETIFDWMQENDVYFADMANELGMLIPELVYLIKGEIELTLEIANNLSRVIGATPEFWLERERHYREPI